MIETSDPAVDPRILATAACGASSLTVLVAEGYEVYERDGTGGMRRVGVDADCGMLDASDSLERLRAIAGLLERRGLAGLGYGLHDRGWS